MLNKILEKYFNYEKGDKKTVIRQSQNSTVTNIRSKTYLTPTQVDYANSRGAIYNSLFTAMNAR